MFIGILCVCLLGTLLAASWLLNCKNSKHLERVHSFDSNLMSVKSVEPLNFDIRTDPSPATTTGSKSSVKRISNADCVGATAPLLVLGPALLVGVPGIIAILETIKADTHIRFVQHTSQLEVERYTSEKRAPDAFARIAADCASPLRAMLGAFVCDRYYRAGIRLAVPYCFAYFGINRGYYEEAILNLCLWESLYVALGYKTLGIWPFIEAVGCQANIWQYVGTPQDPDKLPLRLAPDYLEQFRQHKSLVPPDGPRLSVLVARVVRS